MSTTKKRQTKQAVIFLHIPKAAGSTLSQIVECLYSLAGIYTIHGTYDLEAFKQLPEARRAETQLLQGHFPFGVHTYLPQPSTYITMLRDPIERAISTYYYARRRSDNYLNDIITSQNMTLGDLVRSEMAAELFNFQTALLSGTTLNVDFGQYPAEVLEIAKGNLQNHFELVGLSERFDETLLLLKRAFGWKNLFYTRLNVTRKRPHQEEISQETLALIKKYNKLDIALYEYAQKRFDELIAQQGPAFESELVSFVRSNRRLGYVYTIFRYAFLKIRVLADSNPLSFLK